MYISLKSYLCVSFLSLLILYTSANAHDQRKFYTLETDKPLQEVIDDTEFAITEHNMRITGRLHVGKTIQERGNPDFPAYEIILYCSITLAQKMLELAPEYINYCPGRITIREEDKNFLVTAPLWPEETGNEELKQYLQKMNKYAREIVDFAVDDWLSTYEK